MTPWAHDLDELTHELQAQMQAWRKERAEHAATATNDAITPWAHNLDDLTHEIQDHMDHRKKERAEHAAAHEAAHAARLKAAHAASAQPETRTAFMDKVDDLGRELCQDPSRHDRPVCAQFLHP